MRVGPFVRVVGWCAMLVGAMWACAGARFRPPLGSLRVQVLVPPGYYSCDGLGEHIVVIDAAAHRFVSGVRAGREPDLVFALPEGRYEVAWLGIGGSEYAHGYAKVASGRHAELILRWEKAHDPPPRHDFDCCQSIQIPSEDS